jgi:hypothetical protein
MNAKFVPTIFVLHASRIGGKSSQKLVFSNVKRHNSN